MTTYPLDDAPGYLYEKLANHLAERITSGELAPHTRLPAERRLAEVYGVSLGTARHATQLLRERGLVITIRSRGTFVAGAPERQRALARRGNT